MGLLDEIRKALQADKNKADKGEKKSDFIDQILKEKGLHDALHDAGFTIVVDDPQARARQQPFGLLSTVHKIDLVDLITEITTIKTIENIDLVAAITSIANIASLDLIDRITLIDSITNIANIDKIGVINAIHYLPYGVLQNGSFETGSFYPWYLVSGTAAIFAGGNNDNYCVKFPKGVASEISQLLPPYLGKDLAIRFNAKAVNDGAGVSELDLWIWYVDGTSEGLVASNPPITYWEDYIYLPTQNKRVRRIAFTTPVTNVRSILLDSTFVVLRPFAIQDIRTDLKVQPEREDLTVLGGVASPNALGVLIVAANGTKKIKVWDAEYEGLVDGLHCFYFGTSTALTTRRFLSRSTLGVNSKTFLQPCEGNASDALYLYSVNEETNMPYDLRYVQE